ncbi:hypothetical protein [Streptomyces sp. NPDC020681]|uniref:hypothetical protein n=1 Tax=Streptomyces sp. NPDC020681 TaxID=3365083 RepID=UPI0037AC43F6
MVLIGSAPFCFGRLTGCDACGPGGDTVEVAEVSSASFLQNRAGNASPRSGHDPAAESDVSSAFTGWLGA